MQIYIHRKHYNSAIKVFSSAGYLGYHSHHKSLYCTIIHRMWVRTSYCHPDLLFPTHMSQSFEAYKLNSPFRFSKASSRTIPPYLLSTLAWTIASQKVSSQTNPLPKIPTQVNFKLVREVVCRKSWWVGTVPVGVGGLIWEHLLSEDINGDLVLLKNS